MADDAEAAPAAEPEAEAEPAACLFAFRFQNELARVFFWGQNELPVGRDANTSESYR